MAPPTSTSPASPARDQWGSRFAFIMAAAGSAIGIGNIWRFPVSASEGGGGAFLLVYLCCVVLLALPVMLAEMVVGRAGEKNPVGAFKHLRPGSPWVLIGFLGVTTGAIILSFYSVISGWTIFYMIKSAIGSFTPTTDTADEFVKMAQSPAIGLGFHALFMVITVLVVGAGIRQGIERSVKILMPLFFVLIIALVARAVTLPGASEGLTFYLRPDFSKITAGVWLSALGQAFFSLSLGMGAMITYGSYLNKKENLPTSAALVAGADTVIAITAGFLIFPAIFFAGIEPGQAGPGLVFVALPKVFAQMPWAPWGGIFFGTAFFLLLGVAALTSAISLLEVVVAHLVDDWKWNRKKAAWILGGSVYLLGVPSALSLGAVPALSDIGGSELGFLDIMDKIGELALVVGGLGLAIFVGWVWGIPKAMDEIRKGTPEFKLQKVWRPLIRYVAPIAISVILLGKLWGYISPPSEPEPTPPTEETSASR